MPKVFISYSSEDRDFVQELATDLVRADIEVWWAEWEIKVGDSIVQKINAGIHGSGYLAVVLSPNSIKSVWVQKELNAAIAEELQRNEVFILPILYKDCKIPTLIADKKYADFRTNYERGLEDLVVALTYGENTIPTSQEKPALKLADRADSILEIAESVADVKESIKEDLTSSRAILPYIIFGLKSESSLVPILQSLAGPPSPLSESILTNTEPVYFDDMGEAKEIFETIAELGKRIQRSRTRSTEAFLKIWSDAAIKRAKRRVLQKRKLVPSKAPLKVPDQEYMIFGFRKEFAPLINALRVGDIPEEPKRDATEIRFDSIEHVQDTLDVMKAIADEAEGDNKKFYQLLVDKSFNNLQERFLRRSSKDERKAFSNDAGREQETTSKIPKVGRNDPCPCGSGKKYKHCHGARRSSS